MKSILSTIACLVFALSCHAQVTPEPSPSMKTALQERIVFHQKPSTLGEALRIQSFPPISRPLVVVDGVPAPEPASSPAADDLWGTRLSEIQSIRVLKDSVAALLYGERARRGAILIKTKRSKAEDVR